MIFTKGAKSKQMMGKGRIRLDKGVSGIFIKKMKIFLLTLSILIPLLSQSAWAAQVRLAWNPNTDPDLAGYKIHYGTASRSYTNSINVGNVTTYTLTGLAYGQTYFIAATAYDNSGNESDFSNEVSFQAKAAFSDDFSTDKGWIGYEMGGWERGPATANRSEKGNPDPDTDHSPTNDNYILGFAIGGDYPDGLIEEKAIISPPINCTGLDRVFLKFRRYLNVESNEFDHARIYVSTNRTDWIQVWENPRIDLMDDQWVPFTLDISDIAANEGTIYVKFTMGPTNSSQRFSGWNIDDFEITNTGVIPSEGTIGTELTIYGSGFGLKKGKVLIGGISLKILEWRSDTIRCRLMQALNPGVYDVVIVPAQPKGTPPIVYEGAFVVRNPEIYSINASKGTASDEVVIKGKFFGTRKGRILLEYEEGITTVRKNGKVLSWMMHSITGESEVVFVVPKMAPVICDLILEVYGTIPEVELEDAFTVMPPEIEEIDPDTAGVGGQVTIRGNYFGEKKGKVFLGYISQGKLIRTNCPVLSWSDELIQFKVPKLPSGTYDIIITNGVGSYTGTNAFSIN